jgi:hypothetical protein
MDIGGTKLVVTLTFMLSWSIGKDDASVNVAVGVPPLATLAQSARGIAQFWHCYH